MWSIPAVLFMMPGKKVYPPFWKWREYRKNGPCRALIVAGCLAERYRREIQEEIPEVDAVLGTNSIDAIGDAVEKALKGEKSLILKPLEGISRPGGRRVLSAGGPGTDT